ncbi:MAG: PilZ domain-containing protein [Acidobacteria bacterium]|nr:PilZ domain-containing protein [Acidobacteriota bacterium]
MSTSERPAAVGASLDTTSKYFPIRRSTRLPLQVPLRVTSLDPQLKFAENCNTVTVSAHGCGLVSPTQLPTGTRINLEIVADQKNTSARVLEVVPLDDLGRSWLLGLEMEKPGNFWGIKYAPADWAEDDVSADPAKATAGSAPPSPPGKEIPASVMRRLLSECRLAAISLGACYLQTCTTFPIHAPVRVTIKTGAKEHAYMGTVRLEHVGAGMGIEFTGRNDAHAARMTGLIDELSAGEQKFPEVRVELGTPDKSAGKTTAIQLPASAGGDSLLRLVIAGGAMKRGQFLQELEKQRRGE